MKRYLLHPERTTIWPLSDQKNVVETVDKIQRKLFVYGIVSDQEEAYMDRHIPRLFGKINLDKVV
jgi:hypothetical protein